MEQRTTQRKVSTHTPSVLDDINELLAKGREESKIREDRLNKSIEDLNGKLHQLITLVEKQTKILDHERSAAQDRETRLKKKIQNLEDTVFRLSEVQEKTLREGNEGREKIARQLSDLNPIPTRGGGAHCAPPPPPQVHFLKYLRNALSYGLETF